MKPKGVAEGQPVNIPALPAGAMGGRSRLGGPEPWTSPARSAGWEVGNSASQQALRGGEARTGDNPPKPGSQEKPLSTTCGNPYRKPTQVGGCKSTQARGRTLAKELCKLAP